MMLKNSQRTKSIKSMNQWMDCFGTPLRELAAAELPATPPASRGGKRQ